LKQYNADQVTQSGDSFSYSAYANEHPIGTGPPQVRRLRPGEQHHHPAGATTTTGATRPRWQGDLQIIPDENARKQELRAGTIDGYDFPSRPTWAVCATTVSRC